METETQQPKTPKRKREKAETRPEVLTRWVKLKEAIAQADREAASARAKKKRLEAENPWLGTIQGIIKEKASPVKASTGPGAGDPSASGAPPPSKRKKKELAKAFSEQEKETWRRLAGLRNKAVQRKKSGKKMPEEEAVDLALAISTGYLQAPPGLLAWVEDPVNREKAAQPQVNPAPEIFFKLPDVPVNQPTAPLSIRGEGFHFGDSMNMS